MITPQASPLDALITTLHDIYLCRKFDMVGTISNMQLADINSKPILLTAWLVSASILQQGQNIKNFFHLIGSMDTPTIKHHQMLNIPQIMRRDDRDVYNVLHPDCTRKLWT